MFKDGMQKCDTIKPHCCIGTFAYETRFYTKKYFCDESTGKTGNENNITKQFNITSIFK